MWAMLRLRLQKMRRVASAELLGAQASDPHAGCSSVSGAGGGGASARSCCMHTLSTGMCEQPGSLVVQDLDRRLPLRWWGWGVGASALNCSMHPLYEQSGLLGLHALERAAPMSVGAGGQCHQLLLTHQVICCV